MMLCSFLKKHADFLLAAFAALLVFAVFSPALRYGFLNDWDDGRFIVTNSKLGLNPADISLYLFHPFQDLYTPLPMISHVLEKAVFGLNPFWFHLDNLLLHALASVFLFLILRRLGIRPLLAFFAALLWAVNPQKAESAAWIAERKDVLCGAFVFASVWFFLRAFSRRKISWAAGILCVLALGCKPSAASVPGIMIVYAVCMALRNRVTFRRGLIMCSVPVLISLAGTAWTGFMTMKTNPGFLETNLLVPVSNLFRYPLTALVPYDVNPIFPSIGTLNDILPVIAGGIVLLCTFLILALLLKFSWKWILCALLIIGGTAVPVLGLWRYTDFDFCDRYNYLVSASVLAVFGIMAERFCRMRPQRYGAVLLFFLAGSVIFSAMTLSYLPAWRNMGTLCRHVLGKQGRLNAKVMENSLITALRMEDRTCLQEVWDSFSRMDPHQKKYRCAVKTSRLFIQGHLALTGGQFEKATKIFSRLRSEMLVDSGKKFPWEASWGILYHDFAMAANLRGDVPSAIKFLNREIAFYNETTDRSMRYYYAAAMKADLEKDNDALLDAWKHILRQNPAMRLQFEQIKKMKGLREP